jgi:hypothetical protein
MEDNLPDVAFVSEEHSKVHAVAQQHDQQT